MKLILAIVSNDDSGAVSSALTRGGFSVTKLATTGGFLMAGNTTFISGVEDEKVDEVIGIIAKLPAAERRLCPVPPPWMWACTPLFRWKLPWAALPFSC